MSNVLGRSSWALALVGLVSVAGVLVFGYSQSATSAVVADVTRWLHIGTAIFWLASTAFVSGIVLPLSRARNANSRVQKLLTHYPTAIALTVAVVVVSGILLTFDVLATGGVSALWVALLIVKIAISAFLFSTILRQRTSTRSNSRISQILGYDVMLAFGVVLMFATSLLRFF